jgi:hypothetical protein
MVIPSSPGSTVAAASLLFLAIEGTIAVGVRVLRIEA